MRTLLGLHNPRILFVICAGLTALATLDAGEIRFTENLVRDKYSYSYGIAAADLDGDGDLDLTSADTRIFKVYWHENDGKGNFKHHVIENQYRDRPERHRIADVDKDGKPDVVIVENLFGDLSWYRNSGTPAKDEQWKRYPITKKTIPGAYDVEVVDLDGDGDLDVAASTWALSKKYVWCENPGDPINAAEWKLHLIEDKVGETRTIRAGDFNGDGKPDLLGSARDVGLVVWYENPGDPRTATWIKHVVDKAAHQPAHGMPVDLDGDGDLDVIMANGMIAQGPSTEIVWYENVGKPGKGTDWTKHKIVSPFEGAFEAFAIDLDADGDLDVAATAWGPKGQFAWFENSGDPKGKWTMHSLKTNWPMANQVIAADLDGDKRPDLIAGAEVGANEVRWWRNEEKK
jgi:hypothetical protein